MQGILIGCSNNFNIKIKNLLEQNNYYVVGTCDTGRDILRKTGQFRPKVVILSYDVSNTKGLKITEILIEDFKCIVILLLSESEKGYAQRKYDSANLYFVLKPVNKPVLLNTIYIALRVDKHIQTLKNRIKVLEDDMDSRIIIEKAKGILMDKWNMTEQEAYERLRKQSMNKKITIKKLAEAIVGTMGDF